MLSKYIIASFLVKMSKIIINILFYFIFAKPHKFIRLRYSHRAIFYHSFIRYLTICFGGGRVHFKIIWIVNGSISFQFDLIVCCLSFSQYVYLFVMSDLEKNFNDVVQNQYAASLMENYHWNEL